MALDKPIILTFFATLTVWALSLPAALMSTGGLPFLIFVGAGIALMLAMFGMIVIDIILN